MFLSARERLYMYARGCSWVLVVLVGTMHVSAQVPDDHSRAPADLASATYLGTWLIALAILNTLVTRYELLRIYQC
jgi:hypothetical protein